MTDTDIVTWLRSIRHNDRSVELHCQQAANEIERLREERDDLLNRVKDASILLYDWDGYYDPETGKGNAKMLAEIVEEAYTLLQGESWRKPNGVNQM
jgi:hypothetical protein